MTSLAEFDLPRLRDLIASWGLPASHAKRLLRNYYNLAGQLDLTTMNIPLKLQARLRQEISPFSSSLARVQTSDDQTTKLLLQYPDGSAVESVLMPDYRPDRAAGCLSSQVGCPMACSFCATGSQGFIRNLTCGEIVEQFLRLKQSATTLNRRLQTLVFMGMGEPLLNLPHVLAAVRLIAEDATGHLGWRQITVSTVGLVPQMHELIAAGLKIQLAISLHAPDDLTRQHLIPIARQYPIADIMNAASLYQEKIGRVVIIQYCLLDQVNDSPAQANALADLLANRRMHVNLLTYNPTGQAYAPSSPERVQRFLDILRDRGIVAHLRRSRGKDIAAACGQLRGKTLPHTQDQ